MVWSIEYFGLRKISNIVEELDQKDEQPLRSKGSDFLFLFDLIANSCGLPSTLRVLSYTDKEFLNLCQPKLTHKIMTETSLKLMWSPSKLQEFHDINSKIKITNYVVTIVPDFKNEPVKTNEVEFNNLEGGKKQYTFTVSAYISEDVRMKGLTEKTYLPPFPPRNLQCENDENDSERASIMIRWTKPKGEFDNYILSVGEFTLNEDNRAKSIHASDIWLGCHLEEYRKTGLKPGVRYLVDLQSKTGNSSCLVPVQQEFITKPSKPVKKMFDIKIFSDKLVLAWAKPLEDGNTALTGYNVELVTVDGETIYEEYQNKNQLCLSIERLDVFSGLEIFSGTQYTARLAAVCVVEAKDGVKAEKVFSDCVEKNFTTPPLPPTNLRLKRSDPISLEVTWNPSDYIPPSGELSYSISIDSLNREAKKEMQEKRTDDIEIETTKYCFCKLPETGSGEEYKVTVKAVLTNTSKEKVYSNPVFEVFSTNPFPPGNFVVHHEDLPDQFPMFEWGKSPSKSAVRYILELKGIETDFKKEYICNPKDQEENVRYELEDSLESEGNYVLKVYSESKSISKNEWIKSKPLEVHLSTVTDGNENRVKIQVVQVREQNTPTQGSLRNSKMSLTSRKPLSLASRMSYTTTFGTP